jgi:type IV pilus assembly protein PilQ
MGHMHAAGIWRSLGLAMAAFLLGPLGQGGITSAAVQGPQEELGGRSGQISQSLAPAQSILDVLVTPESLGTKLVVMGDGEFQDYKVSLLKEPARLVLDLWGVQKHKVDAKNLPPTRELARVRIGRHQDKMRLVVDLTDSGSKERPLYRVSREGAILVLYLGEMAREVPIEQAEQPLTHSAWANATDKEGHSRQAEDLGQMRVEESGAGEERFLSQVRFPYSRQPVTENAAPAFAKVWDPKPHEEAEEQARQETESPAPVPSLMPVSTQEPKLEPPQGQKEAVAQKSLTPSSGAHTADSILESDLVERKPLNAALPAEKASHGALEPRSNEPATDFQRISRARAQGALSLAQVAAKTPAKTPLPVLKTEEEDEEDFKISTGMEPGKTYSGQRLDLDLQDIDLDNVFRLLAEVSNLNIIVSEKVKGKVTMRLKNVPWDQALDLILSTQKLGMVRQGNVLRVAPLKDLTDEEKERKRLRQERIQAKIEAEKRIQEAEIEAQERQRKLRPFVTEFMVLNYTKAKDFQTQIKDVLTKKEKGIEREGKAVVDDRTNMVTVTDYPETIERIKQYKEMVDKPTPQVLIEARIVKASKNFARELGVQWGTQFAEFDRKNEWAWGISSATSTTGTSPPTSPSTWKSGAFSGGTGHDFFPLSGWMVNLPATILPGPPGIGLQIGRLAGDLINLDLRLSAAEREGLTKIVSRPKVMTLDNVEATIKQGREIPFTQVNPEGNVSVVYKEASLKTTVTPQISPDGRVRLKLDVTDDFPDRANANPITGNPEIVKRQGTTEVLVRDGETVVIGGVLEETRATADDGVPWLKDVPGLSWLFERKQRRLDQTELLIFVTPFIVQQT